MRRRRHLEIKFCYKNVAQFKNHCRVLCTQLDYLAWVSNWLDSIESFFIWNPDTRIWFRILVPIFFWWREPFRSVWKQSALFLRAICLDLGNWFEMVTEKKFFDAHWSMLKLAESHWQSTHSISIKKYMVINKIERKRKKKRRKRKK